MLVLSPVCGFLGSFSLGFIIVRFLLFVITNPSLAFPFSELSYPCPTGSSLTVYLIFFPSLFIERFLKVPVHPLSLLYTKIFPGTSFPFASNLILTFSGLFPSLLFASFHTFVTCTLVFPGIYEFFTS